MRWVIALALLAACSSNNLSNDELVLGGGTYTEEEFRLEIRAFLTGFDSAAFCDSLSGLDGQEVAETLTKINRDRGVTPVQEPDPDDIAPAGDIVIEECNRIN